MSIKQSKSKYSLFNAISALMMTLVNGLMGIIVTRFVIEQYGSDFNGLNSTANQIVNVLMILEGGFTMASNVALFAPLASHDHDTINGILSATRQKFRKIGIMFLAIGTAVALGYGFLANSDLPTGFISTVIVMAVVPASFNLFYASTYRVLLQSQQREYIVNIISSFTLGLGHFANIVLVLNHGPMWMVRTNTMVCALLNSLLIAFYVKKKTPYLNVKAEPRQELITGTGDVMAQKITGVIYNSAPIVFLSILPSGGTLLASVYAVYNNIFTMLKSLMHGVIDAPRLSLGQLLKEQPREKVWPVFAQYEYAAFSAIYVLLSTCCVLILPFIRLYTDGITDANYYDMTIAILMVLITSIEMLHIPSGHLINMAGEFKISKNFQIISCTALIISMTIGGFLWGVYGMLVSLLLVAVLLAIMEMGYVHHWFFQNKLGKLVKMVLPLVVASVITSVVEFPLSHRVTGYLSFVMYGALLVCINGILALGIGLVFARSEMTSLLNRVKQMLIKR